MEEMGISVEDKEGNLWRVWNKTHKHAQRKRQENEIERIKKAQIYDIRKLQVNDTNYELRDGWKKWRRQRRIFVMSTKHNL